MIADTIIRLGFCKSAIRVVITDWNKADCRDELKIAGAQGGSIMSVLKEVFLPWTEDFSVGHEVLDEDHRRLVQLLGDIHELEIAGAAPDTLSAQVRNFELLAITHFRRENFVLSVELWGSMGGSAVNEHMAEHAVALVDLQAIMRDFRRKPGFRRRSISFELRNWFIEHFFRYDIHLREVLKRR